MAGLCHRERHVGEGDRLGRSDAHMGSTATASRYRTAALVAHDDLAVPAAQRVRAFARQLDADAFGSAASTGSAPSASPEHCTGIDPGTRSSGESLQIDVLPILAQAKPETNG